MMMASPLWRLGLISLFLLVNPTSTHNFHLPSDQPTVVERYLRSSSLGSPTDCKDFRFEEPCQCFSQSTNQTTQYILNCNQVAFRFFPPLPHNVSFAFASFQHVGYQGLPTELFSNRNSTLQALDLSHNFLLSITTNSLAGLENTLEYLNLAHNSLGRNFQPVLDIAELLRLRVLRSLDLSSNGIKLLSPTFMSGLSESLEELYLSKNDLIDVEFLKNAKNLRQLRFLDLTENRLFRLESFSFSALPALQYLDLTDNFLTLVLPSAFNGSALQQISFSQNRLANVDTGVVAGLEKTLVQLDLSFNALKKFPDIGSLDVLEKLNLSSNKLENPRGISTLPDSVTQLDLSSNLFTSSIVPFLSQLPSLKSLQLNRNFIGDAWVDSTFAIPPLEHLSLRSTNMTAFPAGILSTSIPRLRSLDISYNLISALPTDIFANASLLVESLTMSHCGLQSVDSAIWNDVPNLRFLDLSYNVLADVPNLPKSLYELNLKHSQIAALWDLRNGLPNLVNLSLAENNIHTVDWTYLPMQALRNLDLSRNNLTAFPGYQAIQFTEHKDFSGVVRMMPSTDGAAYSWKDLPSTVEFLNLNGNRIGMVKEPLKHFVNLVVLDLNGNQIEQLPAGFLQDLAQLKSVNLSRNHLSSLAEGTFVNLPQLADADFSFNNLSDFPAQIFAGVDALTTISLTDNRFTSTGSGSLNLTSLPSLTTLSLSRNQIVNLTGLAFADSTIQHLDLSDNFIERVDNATFRMLSSLRTLNLRSNRLHELSSSAFWGTLQLQDLDLSNNVLQSVPEDLFRGVRKLTLDVANNNLAVLPDHIFGKPRVDRLIKINLSFNNFSIYPEQALAEQEYNLIALDISHNNITTIPSGYLISVKTLDLSSNPLSDVSIRTLLSDPKATFKLNLASTGLTVVPPILLQFLTSLNLSKNNLTSLGNLSSWEHVALLEDLDLSDNLLADLKDAQLSLLFPKLSFLKALNLSDNPLKSIRARELSGLVNVETLEISNLPNLETFDISNLLDLPRLRTLHASSYPRLSNFPIGDISAQLPLLRHVELELHSPFITNLLRGILTPSLQTLALSGPAVTRIGNDAFNGFLPPAHFTLSLINMSINSVPNEVLQRFPRDTQLSLRVSGTQLTERDIASLVTQLNTENPIVTLSNNLLTCTCLSTPFFQNIDSHIQCDLPANLKGIPVAQLKSSTLNCDQPESAVGLRNSSDVADTNEVSTSINSEQSNDTLSNTSVLPTAPVVPWQLQPEPLPQPAVPTNKWPFNWYVTKPSSEPEVIFEITTSKPSTAASNYMLEGAVAGIVVGLVVLTALIIGGIVFWFRREKRRQMRHFAAQNEGQKEKPYTMIPNPDICPHPSWYPPPQPVFVIPVPVTSNENGGLNQEYLNSVREMYYNRDYLKDGQKFLEYPMDKKGFGAQESVPVDFGNDSDYPRESVDLTDHTDEETDEYSVLESCDMTFTYESVFDTGRSVPSIDDSLYEHR